VAVERGRAAGVPVVLVSPTPTPEALAHTGGDLTTIDRARERAGWGRLEIIDRREDDLARSGLYSEALVRALRTDRRVVCVLNRTGRAQMLGCLRCGTLAACERCEAAVRQDERGVLVCPRCAQERPVICDHCAATAFRPIRIGVTKAREQLETLLREPVEEITGAKAASVAANAKRARVVIGTEAALQRVIAADVVAFLEFDQELGAPRYRAAEQALTLLARASRLVRGREGSVIVQTRQPEHEVLKAALVGDPGPVGAAERHRRQLLSLPPFATVAAIGGEAAPAFVEALTPLLADVPGALLDQRDEGQWLVRSPDQVALLDALNSVVRPPGRLRLQVDPARLPT
jgi:primosomal protein N' (replication factor Y)